jgi:glucose/arabinose dehydrogenase
VVGAWVALGLSTASAQTADWLSQWAVKEGFALELDSSGFDLPTAIAFVPNPGDGPDDPLYFVSQLRGEVKVVTNDRSVHTFATVPTIGTQRADLAGASQQGLAGLCLDAGRGYVFVTFTQPDEQGILRNSMVRFRSTPEVFGLEAEGVDDFGDIFRPFQSSPSHQIGGCQVDGERVLVGVGDGGNTAVVKDPEVMLGKIACLTVEGDPCPDNPFLGEGGTADYVWAHGLRNPFGLKVVDGELYVAENGIDIDRFLKVQRGADHHWDGSDQSIATGAKVVFKPTLAPVQLDFLSEDAALFPERYRNSFYFAAYGGEVHLTGVVTFRYDFEADAVASVPTHLLAYRGEALQRVLGVAFGPDGLYVVPAVPDAQGVAHVLKLRYDPRDAHPVVIGTASDPMTGTGLGLLAQHSCISCHAIDGQGGGIGPSLDRFGLNWRLTERLNAPAYEAQVAEVDRLDTEPYASFREARREVLAAEGRERTRVWMKYFLLEPRFDNPQVQMPNPGLSEVEAERIRDELVGTPTERPEGLWGRLTDGVRRNWRAVAVGFAGGVLATLVLVGAVLVTWRKASPSGQRQES